MAVPAAGQTIENKDLYRKSMKAAYQALDYYSELDNAAERRRIQEIGYRLAAESGYTDVPFSFYLVDMPVANAFALPGGHIFVTRGMLDLGLNDDMLACLLGHEIAHVTRRHGTRMQKRASLLSILSSALLVGAMVGLDDDAAQSPYEPGYYGGDSNKGSVIQGTMAASMALSELLLRNYSRDFEDEADDEGQRIAAGAGFDPDGARQLWELMNRRMPSSKELGYWRTHPFSDQRERAANIRAAELKIQEPKNVEAYRQETQKTILDFLERFNKDEDLEPFLEMSALHAWPVGVRADELRLKEIHRIRDAAHEEIELDRDYGDLFKVYESAIEDVQALNPKSELIAQLKEELGALQAESNAIYVKAQKVWQEGIYQTPFLETFLSNYPEAAEVSDVALALGNAYSRRGRQADAVEQFLRAATEGPESEAGKRAILGLRNLTPYLEELAALRQLASESDDEELRALAEKRLLEVVPKYEELKNGGLYLERYPDGPEADEIRERQEQLADNLYGEVVLYQGVGDHTKALSRIQEILTHAPFTRAASVLRDKAVFNEEDS